MGIIGRLARYPQYRRQGHGNRIVIKMEELLKSYNVTKMKLSAQAHAVEFYKSLGYVEVGKQTIDEHVIHQPMEKEVKE